MKEAWARLWKGVCLGTVVDSKLRTTAKVVCRATCALRSRQLLLAGRARTLAGWVSLNDSLSWTAPAAAASEWSDCVDSTPHQLDLPATQSICASHVMPDSAAARLRYVTFETARRRLCFLDARALHWYQSRFGENWSLGSFFTKNTAKVN